MSEEGPLSNQIYVTVFMQKSTKPSPLGWSALAQLRDAGAKPNVYPFVVERPSNAQFPDLPISRIKSCRSFSAVPSMRLGTSMCTVT